MTLVTLIGEKQAIKDNEFIYLGPNNECKNCKLKTVCFNLKLNRDYKILNIRDKKHSCNIFEGGAVVVEVEELPIITTIDKKLSKGSTTTLEKKNCNNIGCEHYSICNNKAIIKDKKYKIKEIHDNIKCPLNYNLKKAELTD